MTTREPDRFEAKAREVWHSLRTDAVQAVPAIAAALRREREEALERAAQFVEAKCYAHGPRPVSWCQYCQMAIRIRALAPSPEAPPAPYGLTAKAAPSQVPGPICVPQPSEPVAPAPSLLEGWCNRGAQAHPCAIPRAEKAEKRIAELEAALRRAHGAVCICVVCEKIASPAAQGKETRK